MKNQIDTAPPFYRQPIREFIGRTMEGTLEQVDYVPHTHLRIWYNVQPEGYGRHHHDALEVILVKEAHYPLTVNDTFYDLQPGDIFFIPSGMPHELMGGAGKRFIFLLDMSPLQVFMDYNALDPLMMKARMISRNNSPGLYEEVAEELERILNVYFTANDMWELTIYSHIMQIITILGKYYFRSLEHSSSAEDSRSQENQENYEKFANLMHYIDQHYMDDLTLNWAADYVGFSRFHFLRLFKEYAGTTFHDHLQNKRIQMAQTLLVTGLSVTETAFRTGFSNSTTFGRVFRAQTGMTPSEYRKRRETIDSHGISTYIRPGVGGPGPEGQGNTGS